MGMRDRVTGVDMEQSRRERFEELAPGLVEPLRRYLARRTDPDTAEDVLAETLLVCWRRVAELPDVPLPWAYAVARNCLHNAERAQRRRRRLAARVAAIDPPVSVAPAEPDPDPQLTAALASLRPDDAELLRLWAWEELSTAEIAQVLGITANAAGIRLHRARTRLRSELAKAGRSGPRKIGPGAGHEESREGRGR